MGKLKDLLDILINLFTGKNERHNRALGDITDLSDALDKFFAKYRLHENSSDARGIFENIGQAKIDIVTIAYQTRTRIKIAKDIKGKGLPALLEELHNNLEEVKRYILFNPKLDSVPVGKAVFKLHESFKKLLDVISGIERK